MNERNIKITVRMTEREHAHLKRQAENAGLKMEPFVRKLISGTEITPRPLDNIAGLIREVNAIGNNINQIARKVNAENRVTLEQMERILHMLAEIYREVKR